MESINRFIEPHEQHFESAVREIKFGKKSNHWMWFMFPQVLGLGQSSISRQYSLKDLDEACLFLTTNPLGENLISLCTELLKLSETKANVIFGDTDALKLCSSMTLFSLIPNVNPVFEKVLDKFYNGKKDSKTIEIINQK